MKLFAQVALITNQSRDTVLDTLEHIEPVFRSGISLNEVAKRWGQGEAVEEKPATKKRG